MKNKGSESYEIKYWIQKPDGYWKQEIIVYRGFHGKGDHYKAQKKWEKEFKGKKCSISICFLSMKSMKLFNAYKHVNNIDVALIPFLIKETTTCGNYYYVKWYNIKTKSPFLIDNDVVFIYNKDINNWKEYYIEGVT